MVPLRQRDPQGAPWSSYRVHCIGIRLNNDDNLGIRMPPDPGYDVTSFGPLNHRQDSHAHVVQFYNEDTFLLDELNRVVGAALLAGDVVIIIATQAHRDGLAQRLQTHGLDLAGAATQGRYVALDAADTLSKFMRDGSPDPARFADSVGDVIARAAGSAGREHPQVAAFAEMVALLWAEGKPEAAVRLEELWNDLARTHSFSLRCTYPMRSFLHEEDGEPFLKICAQHSSVIPGESYTTLDGEEDRLRSISYLQQKAQALETEKAERKEIQRSLQRRESELAEILENAVEGVLQVGPDQEVLWANRALLSLLGYSADEYFNHPLAAFHVDLHIFNEFWRKVMGRQDIYDYSAELRCKDGSVKHVRINSYGLWEDGQFVRTRCFVRDVTAQTKTGQALRESQDALRKSHDELERRVEQRTHELFELMGKLRAEVEQRTESETRLHELSGRLLSLRDEESRRLARELHDSTGQLFAALQLNLALLQQEAGTPELHVSQRISDSIDLAGQAISTIRAMSYLLHPPMLDEVGLVVAIQWYVDEFVKSSDIQVDLDLPEKLDRLSQELETTVFRIVQEALTNVHRHSGSSTARVQLTLGSSQIHLVILDQGIGLSLDKLEGQDGGKIGFGIRSMRERVRRVGGELSIGASDPGTRVEVILPLTFSCPITPHTLSIAAETLRSGSIATTDGPLPPWGDPPVTSEDKKVS